MTKVSTHPVLAALITQLGGHSFTQSDWYGFAGADSADPLIAYAEPGSVLAKANVVYVLADGNRLDIGIGEEPEDGLVLEITQECGRTNEMFKTGESK